MDEANVRLGDRTDLRAVWRLLEKNKAEFAPYGWPATRVELERIILRDSGASREGSAEAAPFGRTDANAY